MNIVLVQLRIFCVYEGLFLFLSSSRVEDEG